MGDYDLGRLGARSFEHLTQSLFLRFLGHSVGVFGDGPDGGREATFDGIATWDVGPSAKEATWDGYVVLQAKYLTHETTTSASQDWLLTQLRRELAGWANPQGRRLRKGRIPEYFIIATNVRLSSVEGGGVDTVEALLRDFKDPIRNQGLKGWDVWHYDKIRGYLDNADSIRMAYSGLILAGDVLAQLQEHLRINTTDLDRVLATHAAKELKSDSWVKLGQAGLAIEKQVELSQVAIDLPGNVAVGDERESVNVTHHVITHGNAILTDKHVRGDSPRHILIVGGPGQGKSTLSQMIAQCYRAEFMRESASRLDSDRQRLRETIASSLRAQGVPSPNNRRWPMRINLAELADDAGNGTVNLIEWMAQKLTERSHIRVQPRDIQSWLERWPSILILDGLDEVANPYARSVIVQAIDDYLVEAAYAPMDTLLAVTTRPQGYGRELDESQFQTIELEPLETASALKCAERLAESRHEDDEDRKAELLTRVSDALEQELTARLMTTPLQVAIMFLLLENNNRPPRDRHGLFEAYYRTIYAREVNKSNPLAAQLERHRGHVDALHEQVGLKLQALAESAHDSDATLPSGTVEDLARQRLQRQGYEEGESAKIAKDIVRAATDRLVLLVRRGSDDFGYELRSFQEYMAARAITNGTEQDVLNRLRLIAPAAHWRNTWLFAAGRIFSMPNSEHMKHPVITLVRDLDTSSLLRMEVGIGPELALDLLDDDVAHDSPIHRRALLHEALALLGEPPTRVEALARVLLSVEESDKAMYSKIRQEFAAAIVGTPISRATGRLVGAALARGLGGLAVAARQLTESDKLDPEQWQLLKAWQGQYLDIPEGAVRGKVKLSSPLAEILEAQPLTGPSLQLGEAVIELLSRVVLKTFSAQRLALPPTRTIFGPALVEALEDEDLSDRIASAISSIRPCDWILRAALVVQFRTVIQRKPVGDALLPQFD